MGQLYSKSFDNLANQNIITDKNQLIGDARELCKNAGLNNIKVVFVPSDKINAGACAQTNTIKIYEGCKNLPPEEFAALIGHEIIHIKKKDNTRMDTFRIILGYSFIIGAIVLYLFILVLLNKFIPVLSSILILISFPFILAYLITMYTFVLIDARRFWYQIYELKADRMACNIPGVTIEGMKKLLTRLNEGPYFSEDFPWYKKIHLRYFDLIDHPCLNRRIKLIQNYKKWSIKDYFTHGLIMIKWFFTGKGWNGN